MRWTRGNGSNHYFEPIEPPMQGIHAIMSTILIDYTSRYYPSLAGTSVPAVVSGKFVQVRNGNTLYLILSPKELTKYHANIVERFCMDKGIEGRYDAKREKFTITEQGVADPRRG